MSWRMHSCEEGTDPVIEYVLQRWMILKLCIKADRVHPVLDHLHSNHRYQF